MRPIRRGIVGMVATAALVLVLVKAGECSTQTIETSSPQETVDAMANKAVRGVANVTTGWLEFPKQIVYTYREDGLGKGMTVGPLKGLGMTLVRTVAGAIETVTFFIAFPGFYDPLVEPDYVWQRE